jgi:predicted HTH transcriptional regulator
MAWLGAAGGNAVIGIDQLSALIAGGESLTVEFKSDRRQMSDKTIYEEIVSLANTAGGALLIGVEDDGEITGAGPRHGTTTDSLRLQAAIFGNTVPSINTRVSVVKLESREVLAIEVDRYPEPCATPVESPCIGSSAAMGNRRARLSIPAISDRCGSTSGSSTFPPSRWNLRSSRIWTRWSLSVCDRQLPV